MRRFTPILQGLALLFVLLLFFTSIELMGDSFKLMGKGFARALLETTSNPFVGLFIGILATSLVQSSSTVTSMVVTLVAGGGLSIAGAVPIVMGANIGTSVTNTLVSLGSVTRKDEFRRAMAGATVHDFFNLLAVAVLFPLEWLTGLISRSAAMLTGALAGVGGTELLSPVKALTGPVADAVAGLAGGNGVIVLGVGLVLLFVSLRYLVKLLKALVLGRSEKLLHKYIFGAPLLSLLFGALLTFLVQSSSITTSLTVPLVAAGLLTVRQIYPFVLGANLGTTVTAILGALLLASGGAEAGVAALTVAFAHLFFNVYGILIFFPIRRLRNVPIRLAEMLGALSARNRGFAFVYVATMFFVIPLAAIFVTHQFDVGQPVSPPDPQQEASPAADSSAATDTTSSGALLRLLPDAYGPCLPRRVGVSEDGGRRECFEEGAWSDARSVGGHRGVDLPAPGQHAALQVSGLFEAEGAQVLDGLRRARPGAAVHHHQLVPVGFEFVEAGRKLLERDERAVEVGHVELVLLAHVEDEGGLARLHHGL